MQALGDSDKYTRVPALIEFGVSWDKTDTT